jgi:hypothetical protein
MKKFDNKKVGLTAKELALFAKLDTPQKIQDFVSAIPQNFEPDGDSCMSVREVLRTKRAHCIEGALVAALAFWIHGERPLIMDFSASDADDDHIVALFKRNERWGAISKSNHAYLRGRDPVYRTLRELVMSYVHEYYNLKREKTLRAYSRPLDLSSYTPEAWITGEYAWSIAEDLCNIKHFDLMTKAQAKLLRPVEKIQMDIMRVRVHEA